ncbi:MAG: hypothetical protein LBT21_01335 [Oscillospiraceae bacterium]|jgi:alpha-mannosidase|nr:hypothetical protein [Oscillospiraceae bacterium]
MQKPLTKPSIYAVATAHLDTVWNWDFETTIREYILNTLRDNFALFEKYPDYVFSFEGSYRYELMEEYYPELFAKLREYVAAGRWNVTGSAYENGDVNIPSAEAMFRNILYGNDYFDKTFGKRSCDIFLPDCFGFGAQLPTIAAHANLNGFTTQKLTWSSSVGIPFDLGRWQGVDGSEIFASLNALNYVGRPKKFRKHKKANRKLSENIAKYRLPATYLFYGTGDVGGAPKEYCVAALQNELAQNRVQSPEVISSSADKIFRDFAEQLTPDRLSALPLFTGELISTNHGVGCYTSRAIGKRWNKRGEWLADAAERFSAAAAWLGALEYPQDALDTAWKRLIAHQFHDDITGTSLARVYQRSWNDYALSLNQLGQLYTAAVSAIRAQMDDSFVKGKCIAAANPTAYNRTELVSAAAEFNGDFVRVLDSNGKELPSQVLGRKGALLNICFLADVPANGIALFDVQTADSPYAGESTITLSDNTIENSRLRVKINENGDICEIFHKILHRQLLSAPIRMELHNYSGSAHYPAWELRYKELMKKPVAYAAKPQLEVIANGPVRAALKITRTAEGSTFTQVLTLDALSDVLRIDNDIDWQSKCRLLKTSFPLAAQSELASYDVGVGVAKRGTSTKKLYEVPAQNFADISTLDFGVSVFSDCKYGWDHPDKSTLRLTGIHTPRMPFLPDSHQHELDLGRNIYAFGVFAHQGSGLEDTQRAALCFNQPLQAFAEVLPRYSQEPTPALLPPVWGFAQLSGSGAAVRCIKKAQNSDETVIRVQEIAGESQHRLRLSFAAEIVSAREVWASEEPRDDENPLLGNTVEGGELLFDLAPYEPKTFALRFISPEKDARTEHAVAIDFAGDVPITSPRSAPQDGPVGGMTIPEQLYPSSITGGGVHFNTQKQALRCNGQMFPLPLGTQTVHLLLLSTGADKEAAFSIGGVPYTQTVQSATERIAAWDLPALGDKAHVKPGALAWNATHMHNAKGDVIAQQCYVFRHSFAVPEGAATLILPEDGEILLLAATAVQGGAPLMPAAPMHE